MRAYLKNAPLPALSKNMPPGQSSPASIPTIKNITSKGQSNNELTNLLIQYPVPLIPRLTILFDQSKTYIILDL